MDVGPAARALAIACGLIAALPYPVSAQDAAEAQVAIKGMPPRAAATDYQTHAQVGRGTVAAEFKGHSIPTREATFTSEDYAAVEVGIFGPPDSRLTLSPGDFSLRVINKGKGAIAIQAKKAQSLPAQPYAMVFKSLQDPSWEPP